MIKVIVVKENDLIKSIKISGHALYDDYGKDIVCSAVSSIITTSINSILALDNEGIKYKSNKGNVEITDIKNTKEVTTLIEVMLKLLNELKEDYPDNIKISKED